MYMRSALSCTILIQSWKKLERNPIMALRFVVYEDKEEDDSVKDRGNQCDSVKVCSNQCRGNQCSDEDTEEASETDGKLEEYTEIKEEVYQEKLQGLKRQLQQLKDGSHPEYNRKLKILDAEYKERLRLNAIWRDYLLDCVERDYNKEKKLIVKYFEEEKLELREILIGELEEKKKLIEIERHLMQLTVDPTDPKPVMTRKLRRRPYDPIPMPEKRRRSSPSHDLHYLLEDQDIEDDLKTVSKALNFDARTRNSNREQIAARIEDGKLMYERKWFHRGQPVFVEAEDMPRFAAVVSAIGSKEVWVKKVSDGSKVRIYLSQLIDGKASFRRRAS